MPLKLNCPIHVIDFEGSLATGIVEYGIATLQDEHIIYTHSRLCRAKTPIPWEESLVHGIDTDQTLCYPPFQAQWEQFSKLRQTGPLGAHNARFEESMLRDTWPMPGLSPNFIDPQKPSAQWGPWVDTCALYRRIYPSAPSHKLSHLIELFGLQTELDALAQTHCPQGRRTYHAALYDALAAALLVVRLLRCPEFASITLPWLIAHASSSVKQLKNIRQMELF